MTEFRRFLRNALVLVGASLLMRSISLLFGAFVSRQVGAEGMGLFALVGSVYGFAVTLATSGIQLAVTRLCAAAQERGDLSRMAAVLRHAALYAALFGGLSAVLLFSFAAPIGTVLLGDARTVPSLRLLSASLFPIALSSVFSGYFTAVRRVYRNALAQVFEQGVRIALTVWGLMALAPAGLEYACLALVGGSALSELCSFFFQAVQYLFDRKKHFQPTRVPLQRPVFHLLLVSALPLAISAYARSGLVTLEHILIPLCLSAHGNREAALASYGTLHSMAIPAILYPTAVSGVFAGLLVPEVAARQAKGEWGRVRYITERAVTFTLFFAVGCAGALMSAAGEIGDVLYGSREAGRFIFLLAPVIPVMYADTTVDSVLKGLGYQVYSMGVNIADAALSVLLVLCLLPHTGAVGYVAVVILAEVFNFTLSAGKLRRVCPFRVPVYRFLLAPLLAAVGAAALSHLLLPAAGDAGALIARLALFAAFYLLLAAALGTLTPDDYRWLGTLFPRRKTEKAATRVS